MKKQEVIDAIEEYLMIDGVVMKSAMPLDQIAKEILQLVEDKGMLPESYEGLMRDGRKFIREFHQGYDVMHVRNRWEPEGLAPCGMEPEDV